MMNAPPNDHPADMGQVLNDHIRDEELVLQELRAWQQRMEAKLDQISSELTKNTAVCDEMRSYQIAGRVVTRIFRWAGAMAAAAAGLVGLWLAVKAVWGGSPPGPQ